MKKIYSIIILTFILLILYSTPCFARYRAPGHKIGCCCYECLHHDSRPTYPSIPQPQPSKPAPINVNPAPYVVYGGNANGWLLQTDGTWKYAKNGNWVINDWVQVNGLWYYLDTNGNMLCNGWYLINNAYYYLNPIANAKYPLGACYINDITPDGRKVDGSGRLCP